MISSEDISLQLTHMEGFHEDPSIIAFEQQIASEMNSLSDHPLNWELLNIKRISASNTLKKNTAGSKDHHTWDQANAWIQNQIVQHQPLNWSSVCQINFLLEDNGGVLRNFPVFGAGDQYIEFSYLPGLVTEFENTLKRFDVATRKAFVAYFWISTLHPFSNGNGRTARLCADWILLENGHLPITYMNPIESHVAWRVNCPKRSLKQGYSRFLQAILNSLQVLKLPKADSEHPLPSS